MAVPKRIVDVFVCSAVSNVVNVSGQKGDLYHPDLPNSGSSYRAIVFAVAASLAPSTTSPMRSRARRRLGATYKPESFVTFSPPALLTYPNSRTPVLVIYHVLCYKT